MQLHVGCSSIPTRVRNGYGRHSLGRTALVPAYLQGFETLWPRYRWRAVSAFQHTYKGSKLFQDKGTFYIVYEFQHTYKGSKLPFTYRPHQNAEGSSIPTRVRNTVRTDFMLGRKGLFQHTYKGSKPGRSCSKGSIGRRSSIPTRVRNHIHLVSHLGEVPRSSIPTRVRNYCSRSYAYVAVGCSSIPTRVRNLWVSSRPASYVSGSSIPTRVRNLRKPCR